METAGVREDRDVEPRGGRATAAGASPGIVEQFASAVLGGALLSIGLGRRSLGGAALALAGGGLLFRSFGGQGHGPILEEPRFDTDRGPYEPEVVAGPRVLERSITIQKPASELYRAWRLAENLTKVMGHFADVTTAGPDVQHWRVQGPLGRSLEWDSHIVEEHPGEFLRWESLKGADVPNDGWVRFRPAPGDWGTVVTLRFRFDPPGGVIGDAVVKLLGAVPDTLASKALRRFKSLVETGEIPTTVPNPAARGGGHSY
ncbi:SRPBCC family protein [Pyxidicoccus fallax]|uniref:SRPBCC family protein n=1 Tax=Pyxidicoccus fallax TaxID=394095 RepID=A0A848LTS9_9BACT|nr:SRPBCC family protein [Pyxidicoccus fallax]NPC82842.1 SRPBCC family protein [Pyxidicoccus fallax]